MCSTTKVGSKQECSKHEPIEITDFEIFGNVCVNVRVQPRQIEQKNVDYTWCSAENSHKEFTICLNDIAELIISISEVKTFKGGKIVINQKQALNFGRKTIFVVI